MSHWSYILDMSYLSNHVIILSQSQVTDSHFQSRTSLSPLMWLFFFHLFLVVSQVLQLLSDPDQKLSSEWFMNDESPWSRVKAPACCPANPRLWMSSSALLCRVLRACCVCLARCGDVHTRMAGCNSSSLSRVSLERKDPQDLQGLLVPLGAQAWTERVVHLWVQFERHNFPSIRCSLKHWVETVMPPWILYLQTPCQH